MCTYMCGNILFYAFSFFFLVVLVLIVTTTAKLNYYNLLRNYDLMHAHSQKCSLLQKAPLRHSPPHVHELHALTSMYVYLPTD